MKTVQIKAWKGLINLKREIAECFEEITSDQFLKYVSYIMQKDDQAHFLASFFRIPVFLVKKMNDFMLYKLEETAEYLTCFADGTRVWCLPQIPGTRLQGPGDAFKEVSFLQFMYVDKVFSEYVKQQDPDLLIQLTAALYKPEGFSFDQVDMGRNEQLIRKHTDENFRQGVFLNLILLRSWLTKVYPFMFPEPDTAEKGTPSKQRTNWMDIFDAFVGDQIPDTPYYQNMPCMDAFRLINKRIKEYAKQRN